MGATAARSRPSQRGLQWALLLLAAVLLVVLVRTARVPRPKDVAPSAQTFLRRGDGGAVTALELRRSEGTLRLERTGDAWWIVKPLHDLAGVRMVGELLRQLEELAPLRELPADSLDRYELDPPHLRLILEASGGRARELRIGVTAPASGDLYAAWTGLSGAAIIPRFTAERLLQSRLDDWREHEVLPPARAPIDSVWIMLDDERLRAVRRSEDDWFFREPAGREADPVTCERSVAAFWRFPFTEFFDDPAGWPFLGLNPPLATWIIFRAERSDTLRIGRRLDEGSMAIAVSGRPPGRMGAGLFDNLTGGVAALEVRSPLRGDPRAIDRVVIAGAAGGRALVRVENVWFWAPLDAAALASSERGTPPMWDRASLTRVTDPAIDQDLSNLFALRGERWTASLTRDAQASDYDLRLHLWTQAGEPAWVYLARRGGAEPAAGTAGPPRYTGIAVGSRFPRHPMTISSDAVWRWWLRLKS